MHTVRPTVLNMQTQAVTAASSNGSASPTQRAGPSRRGSHITCSQGEGAQRILCPVDSCSESHISSLQKFYDFNSIKKHLNAHCSGQLHGAVPPEFLSLYSYSLCNICGKTLHTKFKGICPKCKPTAQRQAKINSMRNRDIPNNASSSNQQSHPDHNAETLSSLSDIHSQYVPTIRNIPLCLRRLWAQCLAKAFAKATWNNDVRSWTELQMLAKCTLCRPEAILDS